ncbi:MAG: hypothetical protein U5Q44_02020 [Dehalococcoidia bacterium]|nr:hypothetical protein [Dehalococcoidia bacterium]
MAWPFAMSIVQANNSSGELGRVVPVTVLFRNNSVGLDEPYALEDGVARIVHAHGG